MFGVFLLPFALRDVCRAPGGLGLGGGSGLGSVVYLPKYLRICLAQVSTEMLNPREILVCEEQRYFLPSSLCFNPASELFWEIHHEMTKRRI